MLLGKIPSIHRFYRYLTVRGGVLDDGEIFRRIERETEDLFNSWHTFDLPAIEKRTNRLLALLKKKQKKTASDCAPEKNERAFVNYGDHFPPLSRINGTGSNLVGSNPQQSF